MLMALHIARWLRRAVAGDAKCAVRRRVVMSRCTSTTVRVVARICLVGVCVVACVRPADTRGSKCGAEPYTGDLPSYKLRPVIGQVGVHTVREGESFYDIARSYGLGVNELIDLYPELDPWIPPPGLVLTIPSLWIVPASHSTGIVINIPELRLYYHHGESTVSTFPIGIGKRERVTPVGTFKARRKRVCPTWNVPRSLRKKYGARRIPPGPDNPLGKYWIGLGRSAYGIHGTNMPAAIGRMATHGCIRTYPEDMRMLFPHVPKGTRVDIIYEPVKIAVVGDTVYLEAHEDIYHEIADMQAHGLRLLENRGLIDAVDMNAVREALESRSGMPVDVTAGRP
ncbi:MAG: L,D-transpeptidase family protein [Chitinivibrionales bacterium]|nr:L,D-transpeptidase family protein [Chitinivibrionales bacterium]